MKRSVATIRAAAMVGALICGSPAVAAVSVITGPTPIIGGDARAAGDITVINENLAFALAVQSAVPYGVPRGALIDLAPVSNGRIGRDRVVFADFIPNHWSAWPNSHQQVEILESGPARAIVRTTRDWGQVAIVTVYTLESNSDHIEISTTMSNLGDVALPGLLSGLTLWPNSGFLFGVPGMNGVTEGKADDALADRVVAYDAGWAIALHAPYFDHVGDGSMDLYRLNTLEAGASRTFAGCCRYAPAAIWHPSCAPKSSVGISRRAACTGSCAAAATSRSTTPSSSSKRAASPTPG